MTPAGLAELRLDEGFRALAYDDARPDHVMRPGEKPLGTLTIGYGFTGPDVHIGLTWTRAQAEAALLRRVAGFEAECADEFPWWSKLDPVRQDAVTQLAYNLGVEGLVEKWPVTVARLARRDWQGAYEAIVNNKKWVGQVGRRALRIANAIRVGSWT